MERFVSSEGVQYPEPLLPEIGAGRDDLDLALPSAPDGDLQAFVAGAETTLCERPLRVLHTWERMTWPGGMIITGARCCLCERMPSPPEPAHCLRADPSPSVERLQLPAPDRPHALPLPAAPADRSAADGRRAHQQANQARWPEWPSRQLRRSRLWPDRRVPGRGAVAGPVVVRLAQMVAVSSSILGGQSRTRTSR
jgi:hypothetical protein